MSKFRVILDTNLLMTPELHGVDIFSELDRLLVVDYELIVPSAVIDELESLTSKGTASERSAAGVALELASRAKRIETKNNADGEILRLAQEGKYIVGTNDEVLRRKLRGKGIPVIYLRQKSHLAISGTV